MNNIYTHLKSAKLYEVIGIARCVKKPHIKQIIYKQLYVSNLRGDIKTKLEYGTLWIRKESDFNKKFKKSYLIY